MKQILLLTGEPGAGKTTLVRTALQNVACTPVKVGLLTYLRYPGGVELGLRRARFGGTDTLPMHIQPFVTSWLASACPFRAVLAEGDRLSNASFVRMLLAEGWEITLGWLDCPSDVAARRRQGRGSLQDPIWLASRHTKVQHLLAQYPQLVWRLDATQPLPVLVDTFQQHPVIAALGAAHAHMA